MALTHKESQALQYLQETHSAEWFATYGEPGYSDTEKGGVLANWNDVPKGLADWLESCGFSLEWSDEWYIDYDNGLKAYRTSPDSYSWESSLFLTDDGEYLTPDDSDSEWIDAAAMTDKGRPARVIPSRIGDDSLRAEGFEPFRVDCESGFFPGQTDNPDELARQAFDQGAYRVVFRRREASQFYTRWECWAEFDSPEFDRFDICAAYARLESDYNVGGILRERQSNIRRRESIGVQLARIHYRPEAGSSMNRNAWAIYRAAVARMGLAA